MYPPEKTDFGPLDDASLESFAARLAALSPQARLDRDRLMYLAGQASAVRASVGQARNWPRRWAWPAAFSAMTAIAACLLMLLASHPRPKVTERIVRVPVPATLDSATGTPQAVAEQPPVNEPRPTRPEHRPREVHAATYLDLRDRVLALGIDDWKATSGSSDGRADSPPDNYRELLKRMLREG